MAHITNSEGFNSLNFFQDIDLEVLKQIPHTIFKMQKAGNIYYPADKGQIIYFVLSGFVKLSNITEEGEEVIHDIITGGDIFGNINNSSSFSEVAEALSEGEIIAIKGNYFFELLNQNPFLYARLINILCERLRASEAKLNQLIHKDSRFRVLNVLQNLSKSGLQQGESIVVNNMLTHQDIANYSATSRQTVSSALSDLKVKGIISYNRKHITLPIDLSKLK